LIPLNGYVLAMEGYSGETTQSSGFDVPDFSDYMRWGAVLPYPVPENLEKNSTNPLATSWTCSTQATYPRL